MAGRSRYLCKIPASPISIFSSSFLPIQQGRMLLQKKMMMIERKRDVSMLFSVQDEMREHAIKCMNPSLRELRLTGISRTLDQSFCLLGHV